MAKTILVAGFGPGISSAVAERFGREGFEVALVARSADKLAAGARALKETGIRAQGFTANLADPASIESLVGSVRAQLGPVTVLHWNAYSGGAGDLLGSEPAELRQLFDLPVVGLLSAARAVLPDLRAQKGALLVTNGGLGRLEPQMDTLAVEWNAQGLAVANAAKHKLVRVLSAKLKPEGVYVGEVVVNSLVKGTPFDSGSATLEPSTVANRFWDLYSRRDALSVQVD